MDPSAIHRKGIYNMFPLLTLYIQNPQNATTTLFLKKITLLILRKKEKSNFYFPFVLDIKVVCLMNDPSKLFKIVKTIPHFFI